MIPPLKRGDFVTIHTEDDRQVPAMVTLASSNGKSIAVMFDAMIGRWVQFMALSELNAGDGTFEALDGMQVTLMRRTRAELDADREAADAD